MQKTLEQRKKNIRKSMWMMLLLMAFGIFILACGEEKGGISPQLKKITEDDIKEDEQMTVLNESMDYYRMSIREDVSHVYYYSIGYDDKGNLVDKTVISTTPTGMKKDQTVVINGTFPKAAYPSYAIGFLKADGTDEYYILDYDEKGRISAAYVKERNTFFLPDENEKTNK